MRVNGRTRQSRSPGGRYRRNGHPVQSDVPWVPPHGTFTVLSVSGLQADRLSVHAAERPPEAGVLKVSSSTKPGHL